LSYLVVVAVALFSNRYQVEHPTAMCFSTPSGPEDLLPDEEAAQAQLTNQEAARALIELLASTDDDVTGRLFKKGRALPSPTDKSDFIYPLKGGRRMTTLFDTSDVPKELKNLRSEKWKDSQFLRQTFKVPSQKSPPVSATASTTSTLREISNTNIARKKIVFYRGILGILLF
jgi:hypothetical protein